MKYVSALFLLLVLSGCIGSTSTQQTKHQFEDHLQIGTTTKTSVENILGVPTQKEVASSGYECWSYHTERQAPKVKALTTVPKIVSYQAERTTMGGYDLKIFLNPQGLLMDYEYIERSL